MSIQEKRKRIFFQKLNTGHWKKEKQCYFVLLHFKSKEPLTGADTNTLKYINCSWQQVFTSIKAKK
jgi:hypothetical protein